MPKEYNRTLRVGEAIQRHLALLLYKEFQSEPPFNQVTILEVQVSKDLAHAKVFVTHSAQDWSTEEVLKSLNAQAKHLRFLLAQLLSLRITPQLHFVYDRSAEQSAHLSALIDQAISEDEARAKE